MPIPQTVKQQAINMAKIAARESNEVLKSAGEQIMFTPPKPGEGGPAQEKLASPQQSEGGSKNLSFLNEYKQELAQISRDNLFKDLQRKISEGEYLPLENYVNELSYEQREVLKAQMEAMQMRKSEAENASKRGGVREVVSKKGRQMFNKIKKRNEQHVETRMPPSS